MIPINEKIENLPVSTALRLSLAGKALKEQGRDVISFCVGEPDFPIPEEAMKAALYAMARNDMKYTNVSGTDEMKDAVREYLLRERGVRYERNEIAITDGAKYAGYVAVCAVCEPGDEVILPAPYWNCLYNYILLAGAVPVVVEGKKENGYKITAAQLEQAVGPRTRMLLLNNPNNPSGAVYSKGELEALCDVCRRFDITVLADEIYSAFTYDIPFASVPSLSEEMRENSILVSGVSKCYAMTGWRIGYIAAPAHVIKACGTILSHTTGSPSTVGQAAAVAALRGDQQMTREMVDVFRHRRDAAVQLAREAGLEFGWPDGAFYLFLDVRKYGQTDEDFAMGLLEKEGVVTVPCEGFGAPGFLRLSLTLPEEKIAEGIRRIQHYIGELNNG